MYHTMIREEMARIGRVGAYPPHEVEAFMRLEHPTLDALSASQFRAEVATSLARLDTMDATERAAFADSMGCRT